MRGAFWVSLLVGVVVWFVVDVVVGTFLGGLEGFFVTSTVTLFVVALVMFALRLRSIRRKAR